MFQQFSPALTKTLKKANMHRSRLKNIYIQKRNKIWGKKSK